MFMLRSPLILICVSALAIGGCFGLSDSAEDEAAADVTSAYATAVERERARVERAMSTVADRSAATGTVSTDARTLRQYERVIEQATTTLAQLNVPADASGPHTILIKALTDYGGAIEVARRELNRSKNAAIIAIRARLKAATTASARELDDAIAAINATLKNGR